MKLFLTIYAVGGVIWFFWNRNQGYTTSTAQKLIWPYTLYTQLRDAGSVAQ